MRIVLALLLACMSCQPHVYCIDSDGKRYPAGTVVTTTTHSYYCTVGNDQWKGLILSTAPAGAATSGTTAK